MADVKRNLSGKSPIHSTPDLKRSHRHLNNQSLLSSKKIPTGSPARKKKRMTETQILSLITESDNSNVNSPVSKAILPDAKEANGKENAKRKMQLSPEIQILSPNEQMVMDEDLNSIDASNEMMESTRSTPDSLEDLLADSDDESKRKTEDANKNKDPIEEDLDCFDNNEGCNLVSNNLESKELSRSQSVRSSLRRKY